MWVVADSKSACSFSSLSKVSLNFGFNNLHHGHIKFNSLAHRTILGFGAVALKREKFIKLAHVMKLSTKK